MYAFPIGVMVESFRQELKIVVNKADALGVKVLPA